jgi:hypothetical protein
MVKRLIPEELNLRRANFKWVPYTLTTSQILERVQISGKLFGQFNKLQVKDLARAIRGIKPVSKLKIRDLQHA